jgi:serine/threonine-protein kinase
MRRNFSEGRVFDSLGIGELPWKTYVDSLPNLNPGDVLAGKYRIERVLGQGGMGVVVSAHHLHLDERIAIKFLLPEALQNAEAVARFSREARAAVKIKSEHVARVVDVGTLDTGSPYMVMEYLHGQDLGALVQQRGGLPIEEAVEYVLQACEAIAEAHALGIIHRDLKPQNLFLAHRADGSPCVKVLDFGISKITSYGSGSGSGSDMSMTKTTAVMGSPLYMSPEQMTSSRDVDARTDIWALGAILHELLTGRVPFLADTVPQLCAMILQSSAPPLRNFRPDAPEALQNVLLRCLEKDPGRRFRNVAEFAAALLPFAPRGGRLSVERVSRVLSAAGLSNSAVELPPSAAPSQHVTHAAWGQTISTRSPMPWIALALGVLVIGGASAAVVLSRGEKNADSTPEPSSGITSSPVSAAAPSAPSPHVEVAPVEPAPSATPPSKLAAPQPAAVPVRPAQVAPVRPAQVAPVRPAQPPVRPPQAPPVRPPAQPVAQTSPAVKPPPAQTPAKPSTSELYNDRK